MNNLRINIKRVIKEGPFGIYLMAFLIPLNPKWLGIAVAVILLEQIIRWTPIKFQHIKNQLTWRNPGRWLFLFYCMHVVGLLYTENMEFAYMDLGMKSTLAIFPLFFLLYQLKVDWQIFVKCFISGAFISIIINLILATINFTDTQDIRSFSGINLSYFMHRGYWAIYLLIACFFLLKQSLDNIRKPLFMINFMGIFFIVIAVIFTESKVALIILFFLFIWAIIKLAKLVKNKWTLSIVALIFIAGVYAAFTLAPSFSKRVNSTIKILTESKENMNTKGTESTTSRIFLWDSSLELIKDNFWIGVGTGDIKDKLVKKNIEKGYVGAAKENYNSHNQFFNSHIALGILGPLFLLITLITNTMKHNKIDLLRSWRVGVVLILFIAMLTESMLETQAGIIPYAFFLSFLTAFELKKKED